ncbi:hypothetical protein D3C72_2098790 [compost metagenome]
MPWAVRVPVPLLSESIHLFVVASRNTILPATIVSPAVPMSRVALLPATTALAVMEMSAIMESPAA